MRVKDFAPTDTARNCRSLSVHPQLVFVRISGPRGKCRRKLQKELYATKMRPDQHLAHTVPLRRQHMKARSMVISLVTCFVALTWCFAQDAMMGSWKLNEAKSKIGAGSGKNNTVVIEAAGEGVKVTMDGVDPTGKPTHNEWTGKFDGKEYPVTGDANSDARSYKKI